MDAKAPPIIFSPDRRKAVAARAAALQLGDDAARYLVEDLTEDVVERLSFLRHESRQCFITGDLGAVLARTLVAPGRHIACLDFDAEQPWPVEGFDLIVSAFTIDTANDLPGALIHLRKALAPGGLAIIAMVGAGSLPVLREVMLAADGERPAPRIHPQVDVKAGAQLLQRAGFANPVADSRSLKVRYGSLRRLVGDLRAQGLSNQLADPGPPLTRAALARAEAAFQSLADAESRVTETFEILTLSGWRQPSAA